MSHALLIDFGSTYTKLRAVDLDSATLTASGQGPSTVTTDVNIGVELAMEDLSAQMGSVPTFRHRLASSSAAGGLRMITIGLVPELTAKAARLAALGAGAKVTETFAFELTEGDVARIVEAAPDIILLSGGTDGGNRKVIEHNGHCLADSAIACPIVVAGNRSAADHLVRLFKTANKQAIQTDNVMPRHLQLNIEPARRAIRQVFIDHIVHAKGIDRARERLDAVLMPTPAAVLHGAELLADGIAGEPGLGPLMVVDIGGSTTDVHSICHGAPSQSGIIYHGLPEPYAKRTVEGDLGMRHTARSVIDVVGMNTFAVDAGLSVAEVDELLLRCDADVEWLARKDNELCFDNTLARTATRLAVTRHAGTLETVYTASGPATLQRGKDLAEINTIIGTGGIIVHSQDPASILRGALYSDDAPLSLRPRTGALMLDEQYLLYAGGLLADVARSVALALTRQAVIALEPSDYNEDINDDNSAVE